MSSNTPEHLFKLLSPQAGIAVVESLALRWSSPQCFADPFEMNLASSPPFEPASLLDSTIKLASSMIFAPEQPKGDSPLINAIRRWRDEGRFASAEEAQPILKELLGKMVEHRSEKLEDALTRWRDYVRNQRICCFVAKLDTLSSWEKYADNHKGIALKFATEEAPFSDAQPLIYQSNTPQLTTIREQLSCILHNRKDAMVERYKDHHLVKSSHCKSEQEWRCRNQTQRPISADNQDSENWFDSVNFPSTSLTAIYFGVSCTEETRNKVIAIAKNTAPHVKFYEALAGKTNYEIDFEKIAK